MRVKRGQRLLCSLLTESTFLKPWTEAEIL